MEETTRIHHHLMILRTAMTIATSPFQMAPDIHQQGGATEEALLEVEEVAHLVAHLEDQEEVGS